MKKGFLLLSGVFFFIGNANSIKVEDSFKILNSNKAVITEVLKENSDKKSFSEIIDKFSKDEKVLDDKIGITGDATGVKLDNVRKLISNSTSSSSIKDAIDDVKSLSGFTNSSLKDHFQHMFNYSGFQLSYYQVARNEASSKGVTITGVSDLSGTGENTVKNKIKNLKTLIARRIINGLPGDNPTNRASIISHMESQKGESLASDGSNLTYSDILTFLSMVQVAP